MSRPEFDEEAAKQGRIAEGWINELLIKRKYNYKWYNEKKESTKSPDFVIFGSKKTIIAGIECEMKNIEYEKYFKYGLDFLADKIDRLWNKKIPIYYYLVISDKSRIYYEKMNYLRKIGKIEFKDTKRMRNEKFYRVQLDNLKVIEL